MPVERATQNYRAGDVQLREHFEALLRAQKENQDTSLRAQKCYFEARLKAIEDSSRIAFDAIDDRMRGSNEIRSAMKDQSTTFATKVYVDAIRDRWDAEIDDLKEYKNIATGKASQSSVLLLGLVSVVSLIVTIIKMFV